MSYLQLRLKRESLEGKEETFHPANLVCVLKTLFTNDLVPR